MHVKLSSCPSNYKHWLLIGSLSLSYSVPFKILAHLRAPYAATPVSLDPPTLPLYTTIVSGSTTAVLLLNGYFQIQNGEHLVGPYLSHMVQELWEPSSLHFLGPLLSNYQIPTQRPFPYASTLLYHRVFQMHCQN